MGSLLLGAYTVELFHFFFRFPLRYYYLSLNVPFSVARYLGGKMVCLGMFGLFVVKNI